MPAKSSTFDNELLKLIFNAVPIDNIADNALTLPLASLYVSLHTGSPGVGGDQTTNETTYTDYLRVAVARTSGGWTVSGSSVSPTATIVFPACSGGSETLTHFAVGTVASPGAGKVLYFGSISPTIAVISGVTPLLTASSSIVEQ
jgi:hypothetical protein